MDQENFRLKQFLLGNLLQSEMEEIDLRLISDEDFASELSMAESELIEDHLDGLLSFADTELFQTNFLTSPERLDLLREISRLKNYARQQTLAKVVAEPESRSAWNFGEFLRVYARPLLAGGALVLAILVIGVVWQKYLVSPASPLEKEYAELNRRDLSDLNGLNSYSAVSLSPGSFRDANSSATQKPGILSDTVLFRLALPTGSEIDKGFKAKVVSGSSVIFSLNELHAYQNTAGKEARILVPKSILGKGQYQIILENMSGGSSSLTFGFSIE